MNGYEQVKEEFKAICIEYAIAVPRIDPALDTDPCDVTDVDFIRIKAWDNYDAGDVDYHAAHIFGHYICGLHDVNDTKADTVADLIASLV